MCLDLALKGLGNVSPNPLVGCVIVHNQQIIGKGYHEQYGQAHAEVNAIRSVENPSLLSDSDVYVNLEPCSHFGKTPPCADLLIRHKVKRVIIGMKDPFPEVSGNGIKRLNEAGIETITGFMESSCININKRFYINQTKGRPYIILKWAESNDGFISGKTKQISGKAAQQRLHQWRTEEDAFLIGSETLLEDNPRLNVRYANGRNPIRIVVDQRSRSEGRSLNFFDGTQDTIVLNGTTESKKGSIEYIKTDHHAPSEIISKLAARRIGSLVIEGGAKVLNSFLEAGLYDELRVFKSKELLMTEGTKAPPMPEGQYQTEDLGQDILYTKTWGI